MKNQLSKTDEQRLMKAVEKAAADISAGTSPNKAIVKAASEHGIPAGHINLMVNAVNTGRTNAHRSSTEDPLEKAAEFPIANPHKILKKLFPDTIKTAADLRVKTAVSKEYDAPPHWVVHN